MAGLLFIVLMQFIWSLGQAQHVTGGGAYSYSDSSGKKISGTYDLEDGRVVGTSGNLARFNELALPGYGHGFGYGYPGNDFYPTYFSNLENLLQEVFQSNIGHQRLAYNAARKAFDISSNQAGYFPNFPTRFSPPFHGFGARTGFPGSPSFPNFGMNNFQNSAFASSALGPGFRRQMAAITPENPWSRNVNINRYSDDIGGTDGHYSVSSKSYSSSSNINGQEFNRRGAETTVDDNGKVTSYKVES